MFNPRKAAQVIAYFALKTNNRCLEVLKAVKLVYLADRESIMQFGAPILEDHHVSMPQGPVNSMTYSHINGEYDLAASGWAEFLEARANNVVAASPNANADELDELSEADIACLDAVWKQFGHMGKWEIRDWTHDRKNIPEWEDPNGSSRPIPLERIMTVLNVENGDEQADLIKQHRSIDRLFAALAR